MLQHAHASVTSKAHHCMSDQAVKLTILVQHLDDCWHMTKKMLTAFECPREMSVRQQ